MWCLLCRLIQDFLGQEFIPESLIKLRNAKAIIKQADHEIILAVDGGIKHDNIKEVALAGADTFVIGSALFNNKDYASAISKFRSELVGI